MLLAIDTATRSLSLALHDGDQINAELTWTTANQHTVELAPAIQGMLERVKATPADLRLLAVSQGPGSFNGLRIGFSVAKGLAMALSIPLVAVPTLDIIAAAQPPNNGTLIAVVQAGRGRVCAQRYDWSGEGWVPRNDTQIVAWQPLLAGIDEVENSAEESIVISGEVDAEGRREIEKVSATGRSIHVAMPAYALRRAGFLADLAWKRWRDNPVDEAMTAVPLYLHQPGVPHP